MSRLRTRLDLAPHPVAALPFTSETALQDFVQAHAQDLLDIRIIGAARQGQTVSKIDLLGLDSSLRPWIIECKYDLVDSRAVTQVRRYGAHPEQLWMDISARTGSEIPPDRLEPGFILIGYRYDRDYSDNRTVCLAYQYHDVEITDDEVHDQKQGRVSLRLIDGGSLPSIAHPRVSKRPTAVTRIARMAPDLADSFKAIDAALLSLKGVKAKYGGKNYIRYSTKRGVFAETVVIPGAIQWHLTILKTIQIEAASEQSMVQRAIIEAYEAAR